MNLPRLWAAFLFWALLSPAGAAAVSDPARGAIDACIERLDRDVDAGFERVAARCPLLARRLQGSDWAAWLPEGWDDSSSTVSASGLAQLELLLARESSERNVARPLPLARLAPILARLAASQRQGLWARLRDFLRTALRTPEERGHANALERFIRRLNPSQGLVTLMVYCVMLLVVALAAIIVRNEWRVAVLRQRRRARASHGAAVADPARLMNFVDVEAAAARERMRLLLELIVARLTLAQRLPSAAALTVRELLHAARVYDQEDRKCLSEVALSAERARYFGELPSEARLGAILERGRELLARLSHA